MANPPIMAVVQPILSPPATIDIPLKAPETPAHKPLKIAPVLSNNALSPLNIKRARRLKWRVKLAWLRASKVFVPLGMRF